MLGSDPASAYTGYVAFGGPMIRVLMGAGAGGVAARVRLDAPVSGSSGFCEYIPAWVTIGPEGPHALPMTERLGDLGVIARCNGLLVLDEGVSSARHGDHLDCLVLGPR